MTVDTDFLAAPTGERPLGNIIQRIVAWVAFRYAHLRDRRDVRKLMDLDPRLLADIGLEEDDISWALNGPSDDLASHRLQALRSERSRARLKRLGNRQR